MAKLLNTSISVVGRYERDEMTPSIEVAKNISGFLNSVCKKRGQLFDIKTIMVKHCH
ncbi:MAG: XRE family transcriptional regulator [Runella slithyformis]|nr:MAG: XRE family transcriptional regulator [Runella slithyformis]